MNTKVFGIYHHLSHLTSLNIKKFDIKYISRKKKKNLSLDKSNGYFYIVVNVMQSENSVCSPFLIMFSGNLILVG